MNLIGYINPIEDLEKDGVEYKPIIHLRIYKRSARSFITILQGLSGGDLVPFAKHCRKIMCCGGVVKNHKEYGKIIQFTGDQRETLKVLLIDNKITVVDRIKIHGY